LTEEQDLIEKLAALEHEQWSHWMKYFFNRMNIMYRKFGYDTNGEYVFELNSTDVDRWKNQMNTPYSELTEKEKESDREWARKTLECLSMDQINPFDITKMASELEKVFDNPMVELIMVMKNKHKGASIAYSSFPHNNTEEIADAYFRLLSLFLNRSGNN